MGIFNLTDFERQGNIEADIHCTSLEDTRACLNDLAANALKSIQIYTPDLEADLYNNQAFIDSLLNMARGNRHAQIQILAVDTSAAIHHGHLLLNLAQDLTSSIEIRIPAEEYQQTNLSFMLVDRKGFIYRPDIRSANCICNPDCKYRSNKLAEIFNDTWEHAQQDPQTRRLSI